MPPDAAGGASDDPADLLDLLHQVADATIATLAELDDWSLAGTRPGQYRSDVAADATAVSLLVDAGVGVLSEETGYHHPERSVTVVVDPLDGSTNAHRGVPWFATSLCAVDEEGPLAAVVVDVPHGRRYDAVRRRGARRDGVPLRTPVGGDVSGAVVGISGLPPHPLGWRQFRALGAVALDLCAVADGTLDGYVDCSVDAHGPWDYLGGVLICREAGAHVVDAHDRQLVVLEHAARRTPVAASRRDTLEELVAARRTF